jgi:hypothetical protein
LTSFERSKSWTRRSVNKQGSQKIWPTFDPETADQLFCASVVATEEANANFWCKVGSTFPLIATAVASATAEVAKVLTKRSLAQPGGFSHEKRLSAKLKPWARVCFVQFL